MVKIISASSSRGNVHCVMSFHMRYRNESGRLSPPGASFHVANENGSKLDDMTSGRHKSI